MTGKVLHTGVCLLCLLALSIDADAQRAGRPALLEQSLSDVRVVYFFEEAESIDWAAVTLLSERHGCQVTLARAHQAQRFLAQRRGEHGARVSLVELYLSEKDIPSLYSDPGPGELPPDIVIFGADLTDPIWPALQEYFLSGAADPEVLEPGGLFGVRKVYRSVVKKAGSGTVSFAQGAIVNQRELHVRYSERIRTFREKLFPNHPMKSIGASSTDLFTRYELLRYTITGSFRESDFLSGLQPLRLVSLIQSALPESAARISHTRLGERFQSDFAASGAAHSPKQQVDLLVSAYRALSKLKELTGAHEIANTNPGYLRYISALTERAQLITLSEMGFDWKGDITVRETPAGPVVKFRATVSVSGPLGVSLARVLYYPGASDSFVVVDDVPQTVRPHQQFVREYVVQAEGLSVSSGALDSLRFAAEITYGGISMLARSVASVRGAQGLTVTFLPPFRFIPKVAKVLVDKTIRPFYWKAVVDKPKYYSGEVDIDLKTPPGVSAGAMKQTLTLESGEETQTIQFPLAAGSSMADGISRLILTLRLADKALAVDTATIRVASFQINPERAIGFLPDSVGLLEDILRMTDADFRSITDRALEVGDLSAYQVILIGSGCLKTHPSLLKIRERFERFVRQGGSLILFGQPESWPDDVLPTRIKITPARLDGADMQVSDRSHKIFSKPYSTLTRQLTAKVDGEYYSAPAVMTIGRRLITDTRSGGALLSVANMGQGRIIYCGFPLLEQISRLEIHAIHLLANLIDY